jgi:uncharacterized protein
MQSLWCNKEEKMNPGKNLLSLIVPFLVVILFACVTINIYFPAEKVETMAEDIVGDIRGNQEKNVPTPSDQNPSSKDSEPLSRWFKLFNIVEPSSAFAQEATEVSNATIRALKAKMRKRYPQMKPFYTKSIIKEGADGYVMAGDFGRMDLKSRSLVKKLMKAENNDRKNLYQEVATALKIDSSQVNQIGEIFAKQWQKSVP